ncbi:MAG: M48 family metallopeptidase [Cyanobacteria bacterium P01_A01_bin.123]
MPIYPEISSEAFRHPLDQQSEAALRSLPGFDLLARKFVEFVYERPQFVYLMANGIQVGPRQYSTLYQIFRDCVRSLDMQPEPTLFVAQNPQANSYALGEEHPCIVINTGLLDLLDDAGLKTVIAHELGHIKCGHTTLIQMAIWAMNTAAFIGEMTFGLGNMISSGLIYAFYEWRRKAELSADRAALLVTDDVQLVMTTMMKIAGGSHRLGHEISLLEFERQGDRYQQLDEDGLNQIYKFLIYNGGQGMMMSHPFAVERLHYLKEWAASEEYQQIKGGDYPHASAEGAVEVPVDAAPQPNPKASSEVERLRRELQDLQQEIDHLKRSR